MKYWEKLDYKKILVRPICDFKGTASRDFLLLVFLWISFPPAPEYPFKTVSNFFQNLRRYSQLKVDHRKNLQSEKFIILLGHLWIVELTYTSIFAFQFTLKGQCHEIFCFWFFSWITFPQAPEYTIRAVSNFFRKFAEIFAAQGWPPVSATPVANLPPVSTTPVANFPPVSTTPAANFATSFTRVVDTGGKFATGVNDTGGKFATSVNDAGGKLIDEKNQKQKISWHCPFKVPSADINLIVCNRCRWHRWQLCRRCCWYWWQFATGVVDTCGKFATGVVVPAAILPPVSLTPVANLPPVLLIPVVNL